MGRMAGKVVLITGGARGQGRAHAVRMAKEGADVVVTDLCGQTPEVPYAMGTREDLDETAKLVEQQDRRCLALTADAGDAARMREVVETTVVDFGKLDTLVINHGVAIPHTLDQNDADAVFDATIAANLTAVWRTARAALPALRAGEPGSIVVTASAAGLRAFYGLPAYVTSKHAVIGLVRALAAELAPESIRVNAVCPTTVATPMLHNPQLQSMFAGGKPDAAVDDMVFAATSSNQLPIPWVEADDITNAVLYLASDEARYVTGIALPVDAGLSTQPPGITPYIGQALAAAQG